MQLEQFEIDHFKSLLISGQINDAEIISYLKEKGMNEDEIVSTVNKLKVDLKSPIKTSAISDDYSHIGFVLITMIGVAFALLNISSTKWLIIFYLTAAACGLFFTRDNRILGALTAILFLTTIKFVFPFYSEHREFFYKIEIVFIAFISWIPSILIYMFGQKLLKDKSNTN